MMRNIKGINLFSVDISKFLAEDASLTNSGGTVAIFIRNEVLHRKNSLHCGVIVPSYKLPT